MYRPLKEILARKKNHPFKWSQRSQHINIEPKKIIGNETRIFTIGSCFASNLAAYMPSLGLKGSTHPARPFYHSRTILQEFKRLVLEDKEQDKVAPWKTTNGYIHPYKHHLETPYFSTKKECMAWSEEIDQEAKKRIHEADVITITLGLIEAWYDEDSGTFFKGMPPGEIFDDVKPTFKRLTVAEMVDDLKEITRIVDSYLNAEIIITISPIPLNRTFMPYDVRIANTESKSRVSAAVSEFIESSPTIHYFPSYEIVTGAECQDDYMLKDGRHLHRYALRHILETFIRTFCTDDIRRTEMPTPWLTPPVKSKESPTIVESFPLEMAKRLASQLENSGRDFYIYGDGYLTQELLYNTEIMNIKQLQGILVDRKTNLGGRIYGLPLYNIKTTDIVSANIVIMDKTTCSKFKADKKYSETNFLYLGIDS